MGHGHDEQRSVGKEAQSRRAIIEGRHYLVTAVHIDADNPPKDLVVVTAEVPDSVPRRSIPVKKLPGNWRDSPAPAELARFGDEFVRDRREAILVVPSSVAPAESNWLLNPQHTDFSRIRLRSSEQFRYDTRLFN